MVRAAQTLIAKHGAASISLREITDAADVNVASVSYHFGSKDELCRVAIEDALGDMAATHTAVLAQLPPAAGIPQIAEALAGNVVAWLTSRDPRARVFATLAARELLAPNGPKKYEAATRDLFVHFDARLRVALPKVPQHERQFRAHAAMVVLRSVGADVLGVPIDRRSPVELMRVLVPVIAGCLAGAVLS
jgi:AcrR family transcriptional regulator